MYCFPWVQVSNTNLDAMPFANYLLMLFHLPHTIKFWGTNKFKRNRCLIELFCGVVCVVTLPFWHFCWCRGFCHRTESDLFLFLLRYLFMGKLGRERNNQQQIPCFHVIYFFELSKSRVIDTTVIKNPIFMEAGFNHDRVIVLSTCAQRVKRDNAITRYIIFIAFSCYRVVHKSITR